MPLNNPFLYILRTAATRLGLAVFVSGLLFHVLLTERRVSGIEAQVEAFAEKSARKIQSSLANGDLSSLEETLWLVLGNETEWLTFSSPELRAITSGSILIGRVNFRNPFQLSKKVTLDFEGHALGELEYHVDVGAVSAQLLWSNLPLYLTLAFLVLVMLAYVQADIARKLIRLEHDLSRISNLSHEDPLQLDQYDPALRRILGTLKTVVSNERKLQLAEVAKQVAHDIRSPLSALDLVWSTTKGISEERRQVMSSAIVRIKDIANNLLQQTREAKRESSPEVSAHLLSSAIETLISEKRHQYADRLGLEIAFRPDVESYGLFAELNLTEFQRALSNLVDNSVEALENKSPGIILIRLQRERDFAVIEITDNGKGIPQHLLSQLGREGVSFGKQSGSGLGLYQARKMTEARSGRLEIESQPEGGTTIRMKLPPSNPPDNYENVV